MIVEMLKLYLIGVRSYSYMPRMQREDATMQKAGRRYHYQKPQGQPRTWETESVGGSAMKWSVSESVGESEWALRARRRDYPHTAAAH